MVNDFRYALRTLGRNRGFTVIATLTLALGIGLNAAIFGILNGLLFKPPVAADSDRLVWIASASSEPDGPRGNLTYPDFMAIRERKDVLAGAFAFTEAPMSLSTGGQALRLKGQVVSGNMFDVLGLRMTAGRAFLPEEDRSAGTHPVAVIGHALAQRLFPDDAGAVGRPMTINGRAFTVVGVAPPGFSGPDRMSPADVWVPLMMHAAAIPGLGDGLSPTSWWLKGIGRLADGVPRAQAHVTLAGLAAGIAQSRSESHKGFTLTVQAFHGTDPRDRADVLPLAALLMAVTLTVLLIACANVAGLLLSRATGREREIGIRRAVGASRARLVRQLLVESLVLAAMAGATGLLLAMWGSDLIMRMAEIPGPLDASPDWRVVVFTAGVSLAAGIAFGLVPALRSSPEDVAPSLRAEPGAHARPRASRLQRGLVIGQLAVSLVLLTGAGLLINGLAQAWRVDVGFQYADRVVVSLDLRLQNYEPARASAFYAQVMEQVRALPGVQRATLAHLVPFGGRVYSHGLSLPDQLADPDRIPPRVSVNRVWTDFFATLHIDLVRGRDFDERDLKPAPDTAIVSETMAARIWPGQDPLGQRFSVDGPDGPFVTVVGVVRDSRIDEFNERSWPAAYLPHARSPGEVAIMAWSPRGAAEVIREIEGVVRRLDPDLPLHASRPLRQYVAERLDGERALSSLLTLCGGLALFLAALGLYGVMAYAVARRTREIGIRMALGADRRGVVRLFLSDALRLAATGVAAGLLPAVAVTYALAGMLVGVTVGDPVTLVGAVSILTTATLAAAWIPTLRATRVEPVVALRQD
jgi:predicted permease